MNRRHRIPGCALVSLLALGGLLAAGPATDARAAKRPPQLTWDHYFDQEAVTEALRQLHEAYPELTELRSLGRSVEGRDIWALTVTNEKTGPDLAKPALYSDGSIHGNEIQATELNLYLAWYLLTNYGRLEQVTELLDGRTFYIVPTVNVDGRAHFFADPGSYNIGRSARQPHDDDRDGLADEDDYEDVDGDGEILRMRIRDPFGEWRSDPDDPRVMIRVKPGEQGEWRRLGSEGIDNDGDGRVNEDPPGYLDMNRNYGFRWQPRYVQSGAGDYPLSAPNTRAIGDFVASKPNICFAFAWHNWGGMFLRGPGSDLSPTYSPADLKVYDYLGEEGERTVPGYRYLIAGKDLYSTHGDFDEFMYMCWGVFGFTGELYQAGQEEFRREGEEPARQDDSAWSRGPAEKERQKFNDRLMLGQMFKPWQKFQHPTYGEIEIGGWRTFTTRTPQPFMLHELLHRNSLFMVWTAAQMPQVSVEITEVKALGDGLHRVRARAANAGGIPTLSAQARSKQIYPLDRFTIAGQGIEVLSGGILTDAHFDTVEPVEHRPGRIATHVPQFGKREAQWIVAGKGAIEVAYEGAKSGRHTATASLP